MVRVGIVGFGNVGQGTARALVEHREDISARAGFELGIAAVCGLDIHSLDTSWLPAGVTRTEDWREVVASPQADIVAELVGGTGVAREIVTAALEAGKPVVTANKNLIAEAGAELEALARRKGVGLEFEAAVAGGIPVLAAIREGLAGDRILSIFGILNGTCNFILTTMEKTGRDLADVLAKVDGAYNAVWVEGRRGADTMYYGRGAGGDATGIAVVADLIRAARDLRSGARLRVPPLGYQAENRGLRIADCGLGTPQEAVAHYLRFVVEDQPGIIAALAAILARHNINIDAVIQERGWDKHHLPFVITLEPAPEASIQAALREMQGLAFLREPPLDLPIEPFTTRAGA